MASSGLMDPKVLSINPDFKEEQDQSTLETWKLWPALRADLRADASKVFLNLAEYRSNASTSPYNPRISADGSALRIDAVELDTVDKIVIQMVSVLRFAEGLPKTYPPTGQSTLCILANVLTVGLWNDERLPGDDSLYGFIYATHIHMNKWPTEENELREMYGKLQKKYPEYQWLQADAKLSKIHQRQRDRFTGLNGRLGPLRGAFVTKKGFISLGPLWMVTGDTLMLIKGGSLLYIFTSHDDNLDHTIELLKNPDAKDRVGMTEEQGLGCDEQIKACQDQLGTRYSWELVSEVYAEGMINGEMEMDARFERIMVT
ncbi:hypothetical protein B0J11DRAFT_507056 [Dendryphion nanum]|uniref:Uncharacterized protein n=1 Tax=Dendryphion nanum TaxID=256645 RepID=A0A9P9DS42_9PLEO|nr:hypothetical protein B0J11DRAFT_507056 [Dendryphion nanum]